MLTNIKCFIHKLINTKNYKAKAFFCAFFIALIFFLPFIIHNKGYFIYYGDFNSQEIAFYKMMHACVKSGDLMWNNYTDLGANTIGSYTFYLLGSPFFWFTIPFPNDFVPYLMAPLLILKFACSSLSSYIYLKRYVKNQNNALFGALLYAFSGFAIYNIFFNHFNDVMVFFPLLLFALDEYMENGKRGLVYLTSLICCTVNYYFFAGEVVFCAIYFIVRVLSRSYKINFKKFVWLFLEVLLAILSCAFLLIPTLLCITQNYRTHEYLSGWDNYIFSNSQRYVLIIESFFFPPDIPARPNFAVDSNAKWASVAAWLPLMGTTGVLAFFMKHKKHWLKYLLTVLFVMCLIPILNSAFQLFNHAFYTRWYYMLTLLMSLATIISLDIQDINKLKKAAIYSALAIFAIALPIGLTVETSDQGRKIGLEKYQDRFWIYVAISLCCVALFIFSLYLMKNKINFTKFIFATLAIIIIIYSTYIISLGTNIGSDDAKFMNPHCLNPPDSLAELSQEDKYFRIDSMTNVDNLNMFWDMMGMQAFHSIVPGSIMDFYPSVGVERSVASRPESDTYGIRALLSCKWFFDEIDDDKYFAGKDNSEAKMPGWKYYKVLNGCYVWQNEYFIPFGFCYDKYISHSEYNDIAEDKRHLALLKAIVLEDDAVDRNDDILQHTAVNDFSYTKNDYFSDCKNLQQNCCYDFKIYNSGFSATINVSEEKDKLVFFSIPYEKGWSATVNGEEATIEKTNVGFMAVRVNAANENFIKFSYFTPGLKLGTLVSILAVVLFLSTLYGFRIKSKLKKY